MIYNKGIDILSLIGYIIVDKPLFFSCDSANKKIYCVIKIFYFSYLDRVLIFLLDSDIVIRDNTNTTDTTNVSLKKVDHWINSSILKVKMN